MSFETKKNDSGMPYEELTLPSGDTVRVEIDGDCTWGGLTVESFYYRQDHSGGEPTEYQARRFILPSSKNCLRSKGKRMKRINDPALINRNAHEIPDFDYDSYPTVGDVAKLDIYDGWEGYYLRVMPHTDRTDVVIVTDEEYEDELFELPAEMPSWVLEWIAYVYKETRADTERWATQYGRECAQQDMLKALGLPFTTMPRTKPCLHLPMKCSRCRSLFHLLIFTRYKAIAVLQKTISGLDTYPVDSNTLSASKPEVLTRSPCQ